jgi:hypothetical protein
LKAQTQAIRVDEFVQHQPSNAWQKVKIRDSSYRCCFSRGFASTSLALGWRRRTST